MLATAYSYRVEGKNSERRDVLLLREAPEDSPLTAERIEATTNSDRDLSQIKRAVLHGIIDGLPIHEPFTTFKGRRVCQYVKDAFYGKVEE